ncbi:MAG: J domain-containing protein [Acidimicrobiales bacterium]|jgi:DnaJ-domain-containing protein 1|nr:J domain-containing protein [Acidimicrobiales bacterium]
MGIRDWRRIREQAANEPPIPHAPNAWALSAEEPDDRGTASSEDVAPDDGRAADPVKVEEYIAWAERLKAKKARNQQARREEAEHLVEPSYWSTESVFAESRRVEHEEATSGRHTNATDEAYAVLGLAPGTGMGAVTEAYRRLAKQHHPDRYSTADATTRRDHEDRMLAINDALRVLRAALEL